MTDPDSPSPPNYLEDEAIANFTKALAYALQRITGKSLLQDAKSLPAVVPSTSPKKENDHDHPPQSH